MTRMMSIVCLTVAVGLCAGTGWAGTVSGLVTDASGNAMGGVMVSAIDEALMKSVTVHTSPDGTFLIDGLDAASYKVRARLLGQEDSWTDALDVALGSEISGLKLSMSPAKDGNLQRTANDLFSMIKWDNDKDKRNFKMSCTYCHQVGTIGFRSPEEPVDWETMITRMDGFGGLYEHTQDTIVKRLLDAYTDEAIASWPEYVAPAAPTGKATQARITEWDLGRQDATMVHDLELGSDGLIYAVDMINDAILTLDPKTGERTTIAIPDGKDPSSDSNPRKGPHSIERDADGNMWITLALSGQMAKYDVKTGEFTVTSGAPAPAPRGAYPHSLRIDQKGIVWFTDAGAGVFSLDPETLEVTRYKLPTKDQAVGAGKGESRGRTPYGIDVAPDGKIWYTKLNGNRIGRIDPSVEGGDAKEWNPPFRGPRRLHVAPDGIVWVPGFGHGNFASFDPETEEWKIHELPDADNRIPYALSINPKTGDVWICGTGSDSMWRFIPSTEELIEYRMPSRVTYTREVEFDDEGNIWVCNSNYPVRHTERGYGSIIKIEIGD
ncbi:MAG: carboxypeptidase regulatory-like domain-containing protein [Candidatus Hydrogenedentes bacterium]|nr:carboxypeptidase regulatory-like domain-containing protein [Candidatus Hydrogenedentota bacterium]